MATSGPKLTVDVRSDGWKNLVRILDDLRDGRSFVKAGVIGDPAREERGRHGYARAHGEDDAYGAGPSGEPLTNAGLAAILEFGTDTIPGRHLIFGTFDMNRAKYVRILGRTVLPAVLRGRVTIEHGLEVIGQMMASDMRNRIVDGEGVPPPNAPSTVRKKLAKGKWKGPDGGASDGAPRPLLDTGRFRNSITHAVVLNGGGGESE
jgi:hypothetical protein